jgi:hypothetical protein
MKVLVKGDLPSVIETSKGIVSAPDARRPVDPAPRQPPALAAGTTSTASGVFKADRDTRRPGRVPYSEPFRPSTAPFKRLAAFDAVNAQFELIVENPGLRELPSQGVAQSGEDRFYADIDVQPSPPHAFRIPSVGPGAHVLSARFGSGDRTIPFSLWHDSADNWFIDAREPGRLVMEQAIVRAALGGEIADASGVHSVFRLPPNVQADANKVIAAIGVDRTSSRKIILRLVEYFREFVDSEKPPSGEKSIYLDLALSKKGVCRHRAYAFMITALGLGIPTRMIANEAHAWVEVDDGTLFRRIDLGGASGGLDSARDERIVAYEPPPDPYPWPPQAERGEDLGLGARPAPRSESERDASPEARAAGTSTRSRSASRSESESSSSVMAAEDSSRTGRARSVIVLEARDADVRRGGLLHVRGEIRSDGRACERVRVDIELRSVTRGARVAIGSLATDGSGKFDGSLVLPESVRTGDHEVVASTAGGPGCGEGVSR